MMLSGRVRKEFGAVEVECVGCGSVQPHVLVESRPSWWARTRRRDTVVRHYARCGTCGSRVPWGGPMRAPRAATEVRSGG